MKKRVAIIFIAVILICGVGIRIWYVNVYPDDQFTPPVDEVYHIGEWVPLEGAFQFTSTEYTQGYAVKLEGIQFMQPDEYAKRYGLEHELFEIGPNGEMPEYIADLTLNFKNEGGDEGYIQFMYYRVYTEKDFSCFSPLATVNLILHPEMGDKLGFKIQPGSESGSVHFCLASGVEMTGAATKNLKHFPKYLQVSLTPIRKVILIPAEWT